MYEAMQSIIKLHVYKLYSIVNNYSGNREKNSRASFIMWVEQNVPKQIKQNILQTWEKQKNKPIHVYCINIKQANHSIKMTLHEMK